MKPIEIVSYDPNWPRLFASEAAVLQKTLHGTSLQIHHVGSTAVPALRAKPIIDIIAVLKNPPDCIRRLETLGYVYKGELNIPFRFYFTKKGPPSFNLHVYGENNPEIELNLLFRDYLRTHPEACQEYEQLKDQLLQDPSSLEKQGKHFTRYTFAKNAFIRGILEKAHFDKVRLMFATHPTEWEAYHTIREKRIFEPIGVPYDRHHPTINAENHFHFVLYKGLTIVAVAHIEFLNSAEAALRSLATSATFEKQGYGTQLMNLLEKRVKLQGRSVSKMHARLSAESFYRKLGYMDMFFDDPCIQQDYTDLGKWL